MSEKEPLKPKKSAIEKAKLILGTEYQNYWILYESTPFEKDGHPDLKWDGSSYWFGLGGCQTFLDPGTHALEPDED